jgi:hypothetical protein
MMTLPWQSVTLFKSGEHSVPQLLPPPLPVVVPTNVLVCGLLLAVPVLLPFSPTPVVLPESPPNPLSPPLLLALHEPPSVDAKRATNGMSKVREDRSFMMTSGGAELDLTCIPRGGGTR